MDTQVTQSSGSMQVPSDANQEDSQARKATETSPLLSNPQGIYGNEIEDPDAATPNGVAERDVDGDVDADKKSKGSFGTGRVLAIAVSLGVLIFLQGSNISIITTTQSVIASDLDALDGVSWFTSAYVIAMSATSPLAGRLCIIFPPRICMFIASLTFALGAIVTAFAPHFGGFLVGRVICGLGGSGIVGITTILILDLVEEKRRGLCLGIMNSGFTFGVSVGAVLGGAGVGLIGWRGVFLIQAPLAVLGGIGLLLSTSNMAGKPEGRRKGSIKSKLAGIDYLGMATLTSTLVLVLYALASVQVSIPALAISPILLVAFVIIESRFATDPITPVTILKSRQALCACIATAGLMMTRWMVLFYTPVYAIAVRGWSPTLSGSILVPANAGFALGGLIAGWIHIRKGGSYYFSCITALTLFALTLFILSRVSTPSFPAPLYMLVPFGNGLCTGAALNYTLVHSLHITPAATHFIISSLVTTFRGFGASFGSAVGGGIFARALTAAFYEMSEKRGLERDGELLRKLLGTPAIIGTLEGVWKEVAVESFVAAFRSLFVAGGCLALGFVVVQAGTGWNGAHLPSVEDGSEI